MCCLFIINCDLLSKKLFDSFAGTCYFITMEQIIYDRHAKKRMQERSVSDEEVKCAVENPDSVESVDKRTDKYV